MGKLFKKIMESSLPYDFYQDKLLRRDEEPLYQYKKLPRFDKQKNVGNYVRNDTRYSECPELSESSKQSFISIQKNICQQIIFKSTIHLLKNNKIESLDHLESMIKTDKDKRVFLKILKEELCQAINNNEDISVFHKAFALAGGEEMFGILKRVFEIKRKFKNNDSI